MLGYTCLIGYIRLRHILLGHTVHLRRNALHILWLLIVSCLSSLLRSRLGNRLRCGLRCLSVNAV